MKKTNSKIDEIDRKIINLLTINGKMPYEEISNELKKLNIKISSVGIGKRIKKLLGRDLISFTIKKNHNKLGYNIPMILLIQCEYMPLNTFTETLSRMETLRDTRVHSLFTISGAYTFSIMGIWENKEQYAKWKADFIDKFLEYSKHKIQIFDEIFIWDYYKQEGMTAIHIPDHIRDVIFG